MALTITSFRADSRCTSKGNVWGADVPYTIVNICFKLDRSTDEGSIFWQQAKADSEEYGRVLTIDDPERYEDWIVNHWDLSQKYDGYGRAWTHKEAPWQYIEKFDTFWLREWIADSAVTRSLLYELEYYQEHGKLPSVYRAVEDGIILQHLRTLHSYWD